MSNITITVSSTAELKAALSTATGGERILLNSGNYGNLDLRSSSAFDLTFPSNVTIASANPAAPASFSGLDVNGAHNLTFDGINFDYQFKAGDQTWTSPFAINNSQNITISNSTIDGDVASGLTAADNGYGSGIGLSVYNSSGTTLSGNDISTFHRGLVVSGSSDTVVTGNEISDIRSDGMNFIEVDTVLIEKNYIHDFRASHTSGDHADMIQFWTAGTTTPSVNVTIRDNILDIGQGNWTQTILMGNEVVTAGTAGAEMYYQNVVIENNTIYNSHLHGITVSETNGLVIANNTVVQVLDQQADQSTNPVLWTPKINVSDNSVDVTITGNATSAISGNANQPTWSVSGNAYIQNTDPNSPGYYGDVFVASSLAADASGAHNFIPSANGMLTVLGAGAGTAGYVSVQQPTTTAPTAPVDTTVPATPVEPVDTAAPTNPAAPVDTAEPTTPAEPVDASAEEVEAPVATPVEPVDTNSAEEPTQVTAPALVELYNSDDTIVLKRGVAETVDHAQLTPLMGSDNFDITFTLDGADSRKNAGTLFSISDTMLCKVNSRGRLTFEMTDSNGDVSQVSSRRQDVDDGAPHDIAIKLDGGVLHLIVDGETIATENVRGSVSGMGSEDLVFGTSGRGNNFSGTISQFSLDVVSAESNLDAAGTDAASQQTSEEPALDQLFGLDAESQTAATDSDSIVYARPEQQDYAFSDRFDFLGSYVPPSDYFHA